MDPFNSSYYSTAAQVIPVFFLAVLGVAFNLDRHLKRPALAGITLWVFAYVGLAGFSEVMCLQALSEQRTPSGVEQALITAALILPGGVIVGAVVAWNGRYLLEVLPGNRALKTTAGLVLSWMALVLFASGNRWDQDKIFAWGLVAILVTLIFYGLHLMRQPRDPASQGATLQLMPPKGIGDANVAHNLAREWTGARLAERGVEPATIKSSARGKAPKFPTQIGEHQDPAKAQPDAFWADVDVHLPKAWTEDEVDAVVNGMIIDQQQDRTLGGRCASSRLRRENVKAERGDSHDQGEDAWRIQFSFVIADPGEPAPE
jgi:hypothetical protein